MGLGANPLLYVEPRHREACVNLGPARTLDSYVKVAIIFGVAVAMMVMACRAFAAASTWVLWEEFVTPVGLVWLINSSYDSAEDCRYQENAVPVTMVRNRPELTLNAGMITIPGVGTMRFLCLPDTVDPRGATRSQR